MWYDGRKGVTGVKTMKNVLWCVIGTAVTVGAAWLISYIPWTDTRLFRLGSAWAALVCGVLDLICTLMSDFLKSKLSLGYLQRVLRIVDWLAWVCCGASRI